jgi:uncharacterized protein YndB with AHSA1/START domain
MSEPTSQPPSTGRAIELSIEVPGTPQEVWDTIATGPGITSWFVPFEVEGRPGGRVVMDFGPFGKEAGQVTAWEPPHRFAYQGERQPSMAFEWLVESHDGGSCVVRLVNSGFGDGQDWDDQFDGMTEGWKIFLQNLRLQLTHHRGQHGRASTPTVMMAGPHRSAWSTLCQAIGLPDDLVAGDTFRTDGDAPRLAGRIESVLSTPAASSYLLLVDEPAPGTGFISAEGDGDQIASSVYLYLYGGGSDAGEAWTAWLNGRFPAPAPPEAGEA